MWLPDSLSIESWTNPDPVRNPSLFRDFSSTNAIRGERTVWNCSSARSTGSSE